MVTFGLNTGPPGLTVRLTDVDGVKVQEPRGTNVTTIGGHFELSPVIPGQYNVTILDANKATSEHARAETTVTVESDSLRLEKPIVLMVRTSVVVFFV